MNSADTLFTGEFFFNQQMTAKLHTEENNILNKCENFYPTNDDSHLTFNAALRNSGVSGLGLAVSCGQNETHLELITYLYILGLRDATHFFHT